MDARTGYARLDGSHIAYQIVGQGPVDLVLVGEWCSHVEAQWEDPGLSRVLERLAAFSRLVLFDKRGVGLSDPVSLAELPTLEDWVRDVDAVLDAAGVGPTAVLGIGAGGFMAVLLAATRPERVRALVLFGATARLTAADGYPGIDPSAARAAIPWTERSWGSGDVVDLAAPSRAGEPRFREWYGRYQRLAASPGTATAMQALVVGLDTRDLLPSIHAPTLVVHRRDDAVVPSSQGRHLAGAIPDARFVEVAGHDHLFFAGEADEWTAEVEEFLTGVRSSPVPDRVVATVLFTDIVGSTERAVAVGDSRWRDLLDRHDASTRRQVERFGGRVVGHTGDGFLVELDGPARAIACARAIRDAIRGLGLDVRCGIHTGELQRRGDDLGGIAVHIGARVAAVAEPGEILVSRTVVDLVAGSGLEFGARGTHVLKGVPGTWELAAVREPRLSRA